jgi:tRNA(fMet)-specific endonuclease VapC
VTVVGELLYGALNSARAAENLAKVLVGRCLVLNSSIDTGRTYAEIRLDLKRRGRPVPENDLWIAASCIEHGVPLATEDDHFSEITTLTRLEAP